MPRPVPGSARAAPRKGTGDIGVRHVGDATDERGRRNRGSASGGRGALQIGLGLEVFERAVGVAGEAACVAAVHRIVGRATASRRSRSRGSRRRPARSGLVVHHERSVLGDRLADRSALRAPAPRRRRGRSMSVDRLVAAQHRAGVASELVRRRRPQRLPRTRRACGSCRAGGRRKRPARRRARARRCQIATSDSGRDGPRARRRSRRRRARRAHRRSTVTSVARPASSVATSRGMSCVATAS